MQYSLAQDRLTEHATDAGGNENPWLRTGVFWLAAVALTLFLYWICLRFLYPAYFAPLSPFHIDFYDYAAARERSFRELIVFYPRPVTYLGLKILASAGLNSMMAGGVAVALVDVLLTLALVRKMFRLYTPWLLASYAVYALLLFGHPQFYIEHRHDIPAELSWLFLSLSLLAWVSWTGTRKTGEWGVGAQTGRFAMLAAALVFAVLFAFAKEVYFISAIVLVLGIAITDRLHWRKHAAFIAFLLMIEGASFLWTSHFNGPFVNLNADPGATYHISVAPASLAQTYEFYLAHLLNPSLVALALLGLAAAWYDRRRFILTTALVLASFTVFATLAVLPNHKFGEYSWAAAPLLLSPILPLCKPGFSFAWKSVQIALLAILCILAVAGPKGYRQEYKSSDSAWWKAQDQKTFAVWSSVDRLQAIPRPSRVLVSGLEDANVPWEAYDFVRREFGNGILWTIAFPPDLQYRRDSNLVTFINAADVRLNHFDYLATYHANGHLADVRPVKSISGTDDLAETILPDMAEALAAAHRTPPSYGPLLVCADICINWGFLKEAGQFLDEARSEGAYDATFQRLLAELNNHLHREETAPPTSALAAKTEFIAKPAQIVQPDRSGLGVTELIWKAPAGIATEVHVTSPSGPLLTAGGNSGNALTQKWVTNGMRFFLQDVTGGKPLTPENTLAVVKVEVTE